MVDLSSTNRELVIAMGGINGRLGLPDEVFADAFSSVSKKKILMQDPHKAYFLHGLPGIGENIDEIAVSLDQIIIEEQISHLTIIGNCMGGYSAILLGILLNADVVHAFIPKTTLRWFHRVKFRDTKKKAKIWKMILRANLVNWRDQKYLDLKRFLQSSPDFQGEIHLYPRVNNRSSLIHAAHLIGIKQVTIHHGRIKKTEIIRSL